MMLTKMRYIRPLTVLALLLPVLARAAAPDHHIQSATRDFLQAYAHGDRDKVIGSITDDVVVYGSDIKEVFRGKSGVERMLGYDMRLWNGAATIGDMRDVSIVQQGNLVSIFFNADFSVAGRPPVPVRFAIAWRKSGKTWRVAQSSNVVPTQGQSAEELLNRK